MPDGTLPPADQASDGGEIADGRVREVFADFMVKFAQGFESHAQKT